MKKITLFILLPIMIFGFHQSIYGQKEKWEKKCQEAGKYFESGNYKDAVNGYEEIKDNAPDHLCKDIEDNFKKAKECKKLKEQAENLFKNKKWENAKEKYLGIIALNGKDISVNSQIKICEQHIKEEHIEDDVLKIIKEFTKNNRRSLDSTYLMALTSLIEAMKDSNETVKDSNETMKDLNEKMTSIIEVLNKIKNDDNNTIDSKEIEKTVKLLVSTPLPPTPIHLGRNFLPLGIPQFCKSDKKWGTTFLIGEAGLCIAGAFSYYSVAEGYHNDAKRTNDPKKRKAYMDKTRNWETASYTCFCFAGGFYIWQICQGLYTDKHKTNMALFPYVTPQSRGLALLYKF
ncbi:MAG: hypothetical protein LBT50_09215 [Prevotellaceae bacterium]|jgi:outer membrane protein assembly factor BamD (BamD/ComL family)|nr:hypothetical protein [Prevotellaceae bacterium]